MKSVLVKIIIPILGIEEIIPIDVPVGLSEKDEHKFIDEKVEDYKFNYFY